ncbi:MAG TPA: HAD hydrolase-like protein [Thermoanaerobaculaceae bacterium]|nr:HAD hydrolase-like protein [Thermoanaerobaculaceae bacterium]HRS16527.1 HAD hydrolase-like protein [Thermoanaerobaculaceae bacterium]
MTGSRARRPAAVLFDLDGTLADSFEGIERALNAALRELGLPLRSLSWVRAHVGRGVGELVRDAVGPAAGPELTREVERRCLAIYARIYPEQTRPLPGAADVLAFCAEGTDGRVAIVSNKLSHLSLAWVRRCGLERHVALVAGPDTFGVRKPAAGAVLPVLQRFGVAPGDALLVGDMAIDAAAGAVVGMPVVGVRQDGTDPAELRRAGMLAVLFDLRDLPGWLAGNGSGWATIGQRQGRTHAVPAE